MKTVYLDLLIIQGSKDTARYKNVRWRLAEAEEKLINRDQIHIPINGEGVIGLHLSLPGTNFDIVHRIINPEDLQPGDSLTVAPGHWKLSPTPYTSFQPLAEIEIA